MVTKEIGKRKKCTFCRSICLDKAPRSNLYQHVLEMHDGNIETQFTYEVTKLFQKDVLARQLEEGMRIENQTGISLNSQNE